MERSSETEMRCLPSGWKNMSLTQLSCPAKVRTEAPVEISNTLMSLSRPALAAYLFASTDDVVESSEDSYVVVEGFDDEDEDEDD